MELKKYKFADLLTNKPQGVYGIPAPAEDFDSCKKRYLRITDISDDGILLDTDKKSVSAPNIEQYLLQKNDIVFARTGNSTGRTYLYNENDGELAFAGFLIKYSVDPQKVNPLYLRYYTISNYYKQWVQNLSVGSTRGNISAKTFLDFPIILPNRKQQDFLVKVLNDIDTKIAVNKKINKELESMAKELYDYWFVQFEFPGEDGRPYKSSGNKIIFNPILKRDVPDEWVVKKLGEISSFKNGINYDPSNPGDKKTKIINVRNITASSYIINDADLDELKLDSNDIKKYQIQKNDLVVSRSGTPGAVRLISSSIQGNLIYCGFIICVHVNDPDLKNIVFFNLKRIEESIMKRSAGTIMSNISQDSLNDLNIILPKKTIIEKFNKTIEPILLKIQKTVDENQRLAKIRDELLPMLINGQVSVK